MDPMVPMNAAAAAYNMGEIWPFPINSRNNANSTSFRDLAVVNANVNVNQGHDPTLPDHRTSNGAVNLRKRRDEDEVGNSMNENDSKRIKMGLNEDCELKQEGEVNSGKAPAEQPAKPPEPPKQDYIHVRARRGQATDSHSLAERARREKISERMKILQDLVPGCNKVIGKALVLDEIINYVQSLQRQVEFLSMKLEAVNSRVNPGIDGFPSKEFGQQAFDTSGMAFSSQAARDYGRNTSPEWSHMQLGCGFERT